MPFSHCDHICSNDEILPIRYYRNQLKLVLATPSKKNQKYFTILGQRESRNSRLEVKIMKDRNTTEWVDADEYLMQ